MRKGIIEPVGTALYQCKLCTTGLAFCRNTAVILYFTDTANVMTKAEQLFLSAKSSNIYKWIKNQSDGAQQPTGTAKLKISAVL